MRPRSWSDDLAPDVLREIAGRLHVAADFVRFHVCKPWRDSRDPLSETMTTATNQFLPWLLASTGNRHMTLKLRCVFSKSSYCASSLLPQRSWVASAEGDALRYLTIDTRQPRLHDPLTGAVTDLPLFQYRHYVDSHWRDNPRGIVYRDGTTLLYNVSWIVDNGGMTRFTAALLRPGHTKWTFVNKCFRTNSRQGEFCAVYHGGKIFINPEGSMWHLITPDGGRDGLIPRPWILDDHESISEQYNYVLESHGQLLWVSVRLRYTYEYPIGSNYVHTLSMLVHMLEEASTPTPTPEKMRWVRKDGRSLSDRVLFLGSPNSFAVDEASLLGCCHGGCAYFVYYNSKASTRPYELFGVFRYNLVDGKTEFIERLPPEWDSEKCTWLIPQPTIAPTQEINERKLEAPEPKKQQKTTSVTSPTCITYVERHYEPSFRVLVENLPQWVNEFQLERFFNKHGKVSNSKIIDCRNTKTTHATGFVTMTTMHVHRDDALSALQGLVLDGCRLEVFLVHDSPRS